MAEKDDLVKELLEQLKEIREAVKKIEEPEKREKALMCLNRLQQIIIEN